MKWVLCEKEMPPQTEERTYSIYIIRNTVNDKVYIGQTSQSVKERFTQHMKPSSRKLRGTYKIYNAIKKYGRDKFYVETLETGIAKEDIDRKEIEYIAKYDSFENGYNSTQGGDGKTIAKIEDVELFKKLYTDGVELKDIAKRFGVHQATIRRTADSLGLPKRIMKVTEDYLLANLDKTNKEMAKDLGVDDETITRAFKRFGIKRGKGCNNNKTPQNQKRIKDFQKKAFVKMWKDRGISIKEIADTFGIGIESVLAYAKRYGLPKRRTISPALSWKQITIWDFMKGV